MPRRKIKRYTADDTFVLTGPEETRMERKIPAGNDGVALTWAVGVLLYKESDRRPGVVVPEGEYLLTLVGPVKDEPIFKIHKHSYDLDHALVSWEGA